MTTDRDNLNPSNPPELPAEPLACADIKALLSAIVDDELESSGRHEVERHLSSCQPCRDLVSRAETIDALLAADTQALEAGSVISPGFEATVLNRTVYASRRVLAMRRWTMWSGWFAAAACLGLAMTIWALDRRAGMTMEHVAAPQSDSAPKSSWIYDGASSEESEKAFVSTSEEAPAVENGDESVGAGDGANMTLASTETGDVSQPAAVQANFEVAMNPESALLDLSGEETDALISAVVMLTMLRDAHQESFEDVEQVRRLAEANDSLVQLAQIRAHLPEHERITLLAAEGVLLRVVRGPLSMEDVLELRDDLTRLDLAQQLQEMVQRAAPREAL